MSLNVLLPPMVSAPAPPWLRVIPEYERPLPEKFFADALVRLIVPVPVIVVDVASGPPQGVVDPSDHVPEPISITFVVAALETIPPALKVTLYTFALNVPEATVKPVVDELVNASCNVTEPLGVLIVSGCVNVFPALVIV